MASYTAHHVSGTGLVVYAKQLPLNTSNWATGVTAMSEVLTTGIYTATLASQNRYLVFVQAGGSPASTDLVDGSFASSVWDDVLTGATHNIATSAGRRLRTLGDTVVLAEGTAAGGDNAGPSGAGTITLQNGIGTVCVGQAIRVRGQVRYIESYDTNTDVAVVDQAWCDVPQNGDDYTIFNLRTPLIGRIATAVTGTFGWVLANLQSMIEDVSGWRFTSKALEQGPVTPTQFPPPAFIPPAQPNKQTIFLYQGDTYDGTARPVLEWEVDKDFQSWSGTMTIRHRVTNAVLLEATATAANATRITVTLDADDTAFADLVDPKEFGPHPFDVQFTSGNSVLTPVDGVAVITREKTEPTPP
jgi:hypothetical protein